MMEFDRYVALLHGGVLRNDNKSATDLDSLMAALANCRRLAEDRKLPVSEWDSVRRKLTLCMLLNCKDLGKTPMQDMDLYRPFVDLFSIDTPVLIEAASCLNLWPFLVEALPLLSSFAVRKLLDAALVAIPKDPIVHLAMTLAAIIESRRDCQKDSEDLAKSIMTFVEKLDLMGVARKNPADLGTAMLYLLMCVRSLLIQDNPAAVLACDGEVKRQFYPEQMLNPPSYIMLSDCSLSQSLLSLLAQVASALTVDIWMELVDADTAKLMSNGLVRFWDEDNVAPSNMQLLIAHSAFECLQLLTSLKVDSGKVVAMLTPLAKRYDKHVELGLLDLSDDGLISVTSDASGWKLNAYLSCLIEERTDLVVTSSEAMACVRKHAQVASEFVDALYRKVVDIKNMAPELAETVVCVLERCPKSKLEALLKTHVDAFGVGAGLRGPNFDADLRQFSNMLVRQEEEVGLVGGEQALLLALQDPLRLLHQLLDDAAESADKARAVVRVLGVLDPVLLHRDRDRVSVLSRLVQERVSVIQSSSEGESVSSVIANLSRLFRGLAENCRLMWAELADVFVSGLHSERSVSVLDQLVALFQDATLAQEPSDEAVDERLTVLVRLLCHHIDRLQFSTSARACLVSALELVTAVVEKHRRLRGFAGFVLPPNLRGHVMELPDCRRLEDLTHAAHSSKSSDVSLCEAMAAERSLPEVLSRLLPREWDLLLRCGHSDCIERVVDAATVLGTVCQNDGDGDSRLYAEYLGGALARSSCLSTTPLSTHQLMSVLKHVALLQLRHPTSSSLQVFVASVASVVLDKSDGGKEEALGELLPLLYALPAFEAKTLLLHKIELAAQ